MDPGESTRDGLRVPVLTAWYPTTWHETQRAFFREQAMAQRQAGISVAVAYPELQRLRTLVGDGGLLEQGFQLQSRTEDGLPSVRWRGWNVSIRRMRR